MKNSFLIVTATLLVSVFFSCTKERVTAGSVNEVYEFQSVDSTWKLLTLREKIGQTMLMLPDRKKELDLGDGSLDVYFKRYPVTGYFMGWKLFTGVPEEERVDFVRSSITFLILIVSLRRKKIVLLKSFARTTGRKRN